MWLKNGGLLAAVIALLAAGAVALGTWFTLTHGSDWQALLDKLSTAAVGVVVLVVVLLAGWLLAIAFDRAEESFVLYKQRSSDDTGDGD